MELVHADIKLQNVMNVNQMQQPLKIKLIDFGVACPVSKVDPSAHVGNTWYMAPKVILKSPHNEAIDMWPLGLVLIEIIVGSTLYPGKKYCYITHDQ